MKMTGWFCILAASLLFLAALNTVYTRTLSGQSIAARAQSSQQIPWQLQVGIETVSGAAFLVPGLGMLGPLGAHRRRHRSGS